MPCKVSTISMYEQIVQGCMSQEQPSCSHKRSSAAAWNRILGNVGEHLKSLLMMISALSPLARQRTDSPSTQGFWVTPCFDLKVPHYDIGTLKLAKDPRRHAETRAEVVARMSHSFAPRCLKYLCRIRKAFFSGSCRNSNCFMRGSLLSTIVVTGNQRNWYI